MKIKLVLLLLIMVIALCNTKGQLKVLSNGYVGIGTTTPNNTLQVNNLIKFDDTKYSTFIGYASGTSNTGNNNSFFGYNSGKNNSSGNSSSAFGWYALYSNTTGSNNNAFGAQALKNNTIGSYNIAVGDNALLNNTLGAGNIAIGQGSLTSNISGQYNTAVGHTALYTATGSRNSAVGQQSLYSNTTGGYNTAIGTQALYYNTTGSNNSALGYNAGYGSAGVNFSSCTFVGANSFLTQSRTNVTLVGAGITNSECTGDNQVCVGSTAVQTNGLRGSVTWTIYSDGRYKTNIKNNVVGLDFITKLKPVTYNVRPRELHKIWGTPDSLVNNLDFRDTENQTRIGLVAQDVEKAAIESNFDFPGLDIPKNDKEVYCLRYTDFIMPMIKSIQELNSNNNLFKTEIDSLRKILSQTISDYNLKLNELQKRINKCCGEENLKKASVGNMNEKTTDASISKAILYQNAPNPFSKETEIKCFIPKTSVNAAIYIYDMQGTQIKKLQINNRENTSISIQGSEIKAGMYMYSLIIDGKEIDTKKMILTE